MQLTHFQQQRSQNGHNNSNNSSNGCLWMQARCGKGQASEEGEGGQPQQMMCVHKNRALFNFKWPQAGKSFS